MSYSVSCSVEDVSHVNTFFAPVTNDISFTISLLSEDRQKTVNILFSYIFATIHGLAIYNFSRK
jgi:hypothetical protein